MNNKLVARMVKLTADADSEISWMSTYLGVVETGTLSEEDIDLMRRAIVPAYAMMCAAIEAFPECFLESGLEKIAQIERGEIEKSSIGLDATAVIFDARQATFWFEFGFTENYVDDGHGEEGGEVTLAQFKLAVQTYLQFLRNPDRKPIEVPFPPQ